MSVDTTEINSTGMEQKNNVSEDCMPSTSSELMYSEYMHEYNTRAAARERIGKFFEKKKAKPVMLSYGESPLYKKYSELLKNLQESKDAPSQLLPPEYQKKFPIIKFHLLLKKKEDSGSDSDGDIENSRIVLCDGNNEDDSCTSSSSSDDDSSDDGDESNVCKPNGKVQVIDEDSDSQPEQTNKYNSKTGKYANGLNTSFESACNEGKECVSVDAKRNEPASKKLRLD